MEGRRRSILKTPKCFPTLLILKGDNNFSTHFNKDVNRSEFPDNNINSSATNTNRSANNNNRLSPMSLLERFREVVLRLIMINAAISKTTKDRDELINVSCRRTHNYFQDQDHHSDAVSECIDFIKKSASTVESFSSKNVVVANKRDLTDSTNNSCIDVGEVIGGYSESLQLMP